MRTMLTAATLAAPSAAAPAALAQDTLAGNPEGRDYLGRFQPMNDSGASGMVADEEPIDG